MKSDQSLLHEQGILVDRKHQDTYRLQVMPAISLCGIASIHTESRQQLCPEDVILTDSNRCSQVTLLWRDVQNCSTVVLASPGSEEERPDKQVSPLAFAKSLTELQGSARLRQQFIILTLPLEPDSYLFIYFTNQSWFYVFEKISERPACFLAKSPVVN